MGAWPPASDVPANWRQMARVMHQPRHHLSKVTVHYSTGLRGSHIDGGFTGHTWTVTAAGEAPRLGGSCYWPKE